MHRAEERAGEGQRGTRERIRERMANQITKRPLSHKSLSKFVLSPAELSATALRGGRMDDNSSAKLTHSSCPSFLWELFSSIIGCSAN